MTTLTQIVRAAPGAVSQVVRGEIRPLTERAAVAVEVPTAPSGGVSMAQVDARIRAAVSPPADISDFTAALDGALNG